MEQPPDQDFPDSFSSDMERLRAEFPDWQPPPPRPREDRDLGDEPPLIRKPLASRSARLGANLLDTLLLLFVTAPGVLEIKNGNMLQGIYFAAVPGLGLLFIQWVLLAKTGQTIGKRGMGVRIVNNTDETNPGFMKAVVCRTWLMDAISAIPYVGGPFLLIDVLAIFSSSRRCIHDQIADTRVIAVFRPPSEREWQNLEY